MKLLITGATGFIGKDLVAELERREFTSSVAVRKKTKLFSPAIQQIEIGDLGDNINWKDKLKNIECIIHLAGKAHVIDSKKALVLDEFRKINTHATLNLAKQAAKSGVKRFVFLSSIRVNGNQNQMPFLETDKPNPQEPYAISKYEAEQGLFEIASQTNLEVVIIRPPLVYALNAPGNFGRLVRWANAKIPLPLPLGAVNNKRSLVALDNLLDFIILCAQHEKAKNEVFLISDSEDLSTTQLLKKLAQAFDKKVGLLPVPVGWMIFAAKLIGREADAIRLFSSLQVDNSKARELLGWKPITDMSQQLKKSNLISD